MTYGGSILSQFINKNWLQTNVCVSTKSMVAYKMSYSGFKLDLTIKS